MELMILVLSALGTTAALLQAFNTNDLRFTEIRDAIRAVADAIRNKQP